MVKKFAVLAATSMLSMGMGAGAYAATLDFMAEGNSYERGIDNGTVLTFDGLDVTFTSSNYAYFDAGNAGLGVCKILTADMQCNPGSDDNITFDESVTISFDQAQKLTNLMFRAEGHVPLSDSRTLQFSANGGPLMEYTFASLSAASFSNVTSATFAFGGSNADQFYVQSVVAEVAPVPLPASAPLIIAGIGALGLLRRRKKA